MPPAVEGPSPNHWTAREFPNTSSIVVSKIHSFHCVYRRTKKRTITYCLLLCSAVWKKEKDTDIDRYRNRYRYRYIDIDIVMGSQTPHLELEVTCGVNS